LCDLNQENNEYLNEVKNIVSAVQDLSTYRDWTSFSGSEEMRKNPY
jgi:hypothetical protein